MILSPNTASLHPSNGLGLTLGIQVRWFVTVGRLSIVRLLLIGVISIAAPCLVNAQWGPSGGRRRVSRQENTSHGLESQSVRFNLLQLPSTRSARTTLSSNASFVWDARPLRSGLADLAKAHEIDFWLDRRVDPSLPISFSPDAERRTLSDALRSIVKQHGLDFALVENVIYVGPADSVAVVQHAAIRFHDAFSQHLESQTGQTAAERRMFEWPELSTYQNLLTSISDAWELNIASELPHDLLHAGSLRNPCTLATQLALIGIGFSKRPMLEEDGEINFRELDANSRWSGIYRPDQLDQAKLARATLTKLQRTLGGNVRKQGTTIQVTGSTKFHLALLAPPPAKAEKPIDLKNQRFKFEVLNKPIEVVIRSLAGGIPLDFQFHESVSTAKRQELVSFEVDGADFDQLMEALSKASGLSVTQDGTTVLLK